MTNMFICQSGQVLTLVLLNPDLSFFDNSVDPDQKPSDQDPHCFPLRLKTHAHNWNAAVGEECCT